MSNPIAGRGLGMPAAAARCAILAAAFALTALWTAPSAAQVFRYGHGMPLPQPSRLNDPELARFAALRDAAEERREAITALKFAPAHLVREPLEAFQAAHPTRPERYDPSWVRRTTAFPPLSDEVLEFLTLRDGPASAQ